MNLISLYPHSILSLAALLVLDTRRHSTLWAQYGA